MQEVTQETSPEPIVTSSGDAPASFDELEALESLTSKAEPKTEKEPKAAKEKKEPEQTEKDSKDPVEASKEKTEEVEKDFKPVKTIKIRAGDQDVEIAPDAKVPVKVDGKIEEIPIQEIINGYSGQSSLDRKFASFQKEQKQFHGERDALNGVLTQAHDLLVNQNDLRGFVELVADIMGADPKEVFENSIGPIRTKFEEYSSLSPEERQARMVQEELDYYKKRDESLRAQRAEQSEMAKVEQDVSAILESSGMDKDTFVKRYDEMVAAGRDADEITPQQVAAYHRDVSIVDSVEKALEQYAPDLENRDEEFRRLATLAVQTEATPEEVEEIVKTLYENQAERKLSKKINTMERKHRAEVPVKDAQKDPSFFDDLE